MKRTLLWLAAICLAFTLPGQTVFTDNFEAGTTNWVLTNNWGTTTTQSYSPSYSLSESPTGNYGDNETSYATMANGVNLSNVPSAELKFYMRYQIEAGFDYVYIDASGDNFTTYTTLAVKDGVNNTWAQYTYDLGGFCGPGNTNIKIRFRFESDGGFTMDGMYIDNFEIITSNNDLSPPLIVHTFPTHYQGSIGSYTVLTNIVDFSGIASSTVHYWVDNVAQTPVTGTQATGTNVFTFIIPQQSAGSWVKYIITATDSSTNANSAVSDTGRYISGNYIGYDNGVVSFYRPVGPAEATTAVAVKITLGNTDLKTLLIRNYTDQNNPNNPMQVHIWTSVAGMPGTDVITPITMTPEATLSNTRPMTRVDLRPYAASLTGLSGDYFIGYTVPTGICNTVETSPGIGGRSVYKTSAGTWVTATQDFHFRAITTPDIDVVGPQIVNQNVPVHYESGVGIQTVVTTITDATGVAPSTVKLYSIADGVVQSPVTGQISGANQYSFTLPAFTPGTWVNYWIEASDQVSPTPNVTVTDTFMFIAGNYIKYDNGQVDFYGTVGPAGTSGIQAAAVRVTLNGTADLVTMLIRNYDGTGNTTPTPPNAPMLIHVWNDVAGLPGTDMLTTAVYANAESTVANNMRFTRVDLRPYSSVLSGLSGDFHIGFSVPTGVTNLLMTQPGTFNRTSVSDGMQWFAATGTSGISDYHFRCITSEVITSVTEPKEAGIAVFPNPSEGRILVGLEGIQPGSARLVVTDLTGRIVYDEVLDISGSPQTESLDLSNLPAGIYTLGVISEDFRNTSKIVIH
jgi:hypothetical protein